MSSEHDQPKEKTFQVVDKRRFDSSGQERNAEASTTIHTVSSSSAFSEDKQTAEVQVTAGTERVAARSEQFTMREAPAFDEAESVAFTSFLMSLATQVLVQLGEMQPPDGMNIPVDLESARQTIDIIAMLQRRTKGNLSSEEARFIEEVLHSLRVSFINAKKKTNT